MKTYLVGGAVRDLLLGKQPKDNDYVVVGSTPKEMLDKGFKQVGADFPVFLHPEYGDEFALARTEKKEYTGYCGFTSNWEGVSLEQDLERRDLTINSMALTNEGEVVDPFNGKEDIDNKVLRHTSEAFAEDPVRVLRVGRFLARFGDDWTVAPETYALCQKVAWSEFESLTAERVFKEMDKALSEPHPWLFFEFLHMLDFHWFRELWDLKNIPQPITHHPENCCFEHTMLCLKQGKVVQASNKELFAILCHDLGKAPCFKERRNHHGHEVEGLPYVNAICDRLKVPSDYRDLALKVCENHQRGHKAFVLKPKSIHKLFKKLDCFRKPDILHHFVICNWADATGRTGLEFKHYTQGEFLHACLDAAKKVKAAHVIHQSANKELTGAELGERIRIHQIDAIRGVQRQWKN